MALIKQTSEEIKTLFAAYAMADGAGRDHWRENAGKEFKVIESRLTNELVEATLGMPTDLESKAWVDNYLAQIMVALYGNHGPLYTRPGEITFHDHMESKRESQAPKRRPMPAEFNWDDPQPGEWLKNIFKEVETHFRDGVQNLFSRINFYDYVHVTAGG